MTVSITCSCNQLYDHMACTLMAHFAHMRVLTCAGTRTCAISSLQAAARWLLLVCMMQENNFACFYTFTLFGLLLNNVSTSRSFNPAADCWAIRRPLPADYGRPWCIRLGHISSIASTALSRTAANADHAGFNVRLISRSDLFNCMHSFCQNLLQLWIIQHTLSRICLDPECLSQEQCSVECLTL